jgi:type IV pilus assembly protein PilQ
VSAEIAQGVQIPYQTTANNTTTTQFKDAALILRVTPQITAANTVIMTIAVDNGSVDQLLTTPSGVVPVIRTQRANTSVLVNNGETTVLGGIYVNSEQTTNDKTPGLNRLPLLGWLFKHDALKDESAELLIFITPRIIKG